MKHVLCTLILFLTILPLSLAQEKEKFRLFSKKESKKEAQAKNKRLLLVIDSLENELKIQHTEIPLFDTLAVVNNTLMGDDVFPIIDPREADTDSLLDTWYQQRQLSIFDAYSPGAIDSIEYSSMIPDSVIIERLEKMNSFITMPYNDIVRKFIIYYIQKMPASAERILGLSPYYMPIFEEIFDQYDLPLELKAMAIIESALNPVAVSRAKARGMWQFMYATAKQYDLTINSYVDERYDPIKSGHAAAEYLEDSYNVFGDWLLAIASYNCGMGNVNKAIRRSGGSKDFWTIYRYLPRETRGYVPSFIAALYLLEYHQEHNIVPAKMDMPIYVDTIKINKMLHFDQITHFTGIPNDLLRSLNPQYLHKIIPGIQREYDLRLPHSYINKFVDNEDVIYKYKDSVYFNNGALKKITKSIPTSSTRIVHRVRSNETLGHLAMRYRVGVSEIKRWNRIGNMIRVGQRLVIYTSGSGPKTTTTAKKSTKTKTSVTKGYVMYTVKSGDNLWDISRKFTGVTMSGIMKLNGLTRNSKIFPGAKLKIKKSN